MKNMIQNCSKTLQLVAFTLPISHKLFKSVEAFVHLIAIIENVGRRTHIWIQNIFLYVSMYTIYMLMLLSIQKKSKDERLLMHSDGSQKYIKSRVKMKLTTEKCIIYSGEIICKTL